VRLCLVRGVLLAASALAVASPEKDRAELRLGAFLAAAPGEAARADQVGQGAALAAGEFQSRTGIAVELVAAPAARQWRDGAGELIRLVFEQRIGAVLGPLDGRSAHLALQVAARAKGSLVLLSPWVTDSSLTRIGLPWFFRLVPDDRSQAEALLKEVHRQHHPGSVVLLVSEADYDLSHTATEIENEAARLGLPEPRRMPVREGDPSGSAAEIMSGSPGALVLLVRPLEASRIVREVRRRAPDLPFYGPLALAVPEFLGPAGRAAEGMILAAPPYPEGKAALEFQDRFRKEYGCEASLPAAFGYDGANLLIRALHDSGQRPGGDPASVMSGMRYAGLTGPVRFNAAGDRVGPACLVRVRQGQLVRLQDGESGHLDGPSTPPPRP